MSDPDRRYWLSYNGEVYNYRDLRGGLTTRWSFATAGDTEVVLAGLVLDGPDFLDRMEGMWALALWDAETGMLLLARDRMGKKPLYYRHARAGIACASELPALRALAPESWTEDADSSADFLRYGYALPGHTAYRDVREVLPGHSLTWTAAAGERQLPYWRLSLGTFQSNRTAAARRLRETLTAAVEKRLVADVEVGAFLSGGVDSSLVAAIARNELGRPLRTFTIGFADRAYDERAYAWQVARHLGTDHHAEVLPAFEEAELERLVLAHVGQPFADSSLLPTALVSTVAAEHVKVALSGDGGDELFCGYQRYQARQWLRWYTRLPRGWRGGIESLLRLFPEPRAHHSRSLLKKAHLFLDLAARLQAETPYFAPLMFSPPVLQALAPDLTGHGHAPPGIPAVTEPDDLQRMMAADALIYLPQDILTKVDRASMAHSLEVRAPFLDRAVVELAFSLPRHWHRRGFAGKRMLREACGELLPKPIWQRRKQGFGVPIHDWFRGPLGARLQELARDDCGPLAGPVVLALLDEHLTRRRDHGYRLWLLYVYLLWRGQGLGMPASVPQA